MDFKSVQFKCRMVLFYMIWEKSRLRASKKILQFLLMSSTVLRAADIRHTEVLLTSQVRSSLNPINPDVVLGPSPFVQRSRTNKKTIRISFSLAKSPFLTLRDLAKAQPDLSKTNLIALSKHRYGVWTSHNFFCSSFEKKSQAFFCIRMAVSSYTTTSRAYSLD